MSKINSIQAAALNSPVKKTEPTKPASAKPVATKATSAKSAAVKPATSVNTQKVDSSKADKSKSAKPAKEKTPKLKMERDSFTMPKVEYAQIYVLKERLTQLGQPAKKSELLRAGIMQLSAMTDAALKTALSKVPAIKTGRPKKK